MDFFIQDKNGYISTMRHKEISNSGEILREITECFNRALNIAKREIGNKGQKSKDDVDMIPTLNAGKNPAGDRIYRMDTDSWNVESYGMVHFYEGCFSVPKEIRKRFAEEITNELLEAISPKIGMLTAAYENVTVHIGVIDKEIEDLLNHAEKNSTAVKINIEKGKK